MQNIMYYNCHKLKQIQKLRRYKDFPIQTKTEQVNHHRCYLIRNTKGTFCREKTNKQPPKKKNEKVHILVTKYCKNIKL
jgi:hypothetical protein